MRKTIKLSLTLILACVMLFAVAMVASAAEPTDSGDVSYNASSSVKWEYYEDTKTFVLSGTGRTVMYASATDRPFHKYASVVENVVIEEGITDIGDFFFRQFSKITSVRFPDTLKVIRTGSFTLCTSLRDIYFGTGVATIQTNAFSNNMPYRVYITDLANWCSIDFKSSSSNPVSCTPAQLTAYPDSGLYINGERVVDLVIPEGITEIKKYAFLRMEQLKSVTFPDSLRTIGSTAFGACRQLNTAYFNNSTVDIAGYAFSSCTRLRYIYVNNFPAFAANTYAVVSSVPHNINGSRMYVDGLELIRYADPASAKNRHLVIPEGTTALESRALYARHDIFEVTIPASVTTIGGTKKIDGPFAYCDNLTKVNGVSGTQVAFNGGTITIDEYATSVLGAQFNAITPVLAAGVTSEDMEDTTLEVGSSVTFTASVTNADATYKSIIWTSSAPNVARVTAGQVFAMAAGEATITASTADGAYSTSCTITVPAIAVEGITLDATTAELEAGHKLTLIPTIAPANASNKAITWTSSNRAVATVNAKGVVTPVADGEATITATTADGSFEASCVVTVTGFVVVPDTVAVTGVELDIEAASLKVDETVQLEAIVAPADATNKDVVWSTNAADVATVNNGLVTAVGVGNAIITVTTVDGEFTDTCTIAVLPKVVPATSVTLNETELELEIDGTATLVATILPADSTETEVVWTSDAEGVATVDGGVVTAVGAGTATIKATVGEVYAECIVTVKAPEVFVAPSYITLVGQDDNGTLVLNLAPGQTYEPVIEFWTEDDEVASAVELDWYVSDSEAVSVENGVITANAVATGVTIEILALDADQYPDVYGYIEIEVANILVSEITLNKTELSMALEGINQTFQLEATVAPTDATDATYTWATSDDTVATVDENGLVTAVGEGTAEITATANDEGGVVATCIVKVAAGSETPIDPWNN